MVYLPTFWLYVCYIYLHFGSMYGIFTNILALCMVYVRTFWLHVWYIYLHFGFHVWYIYLHFGSMYGIFTYILALCMVYLPTFWLHVWYIYLHFGSMYGIFTYILAPCMGIFTYMNGLNLTLRFLGFSPSPWKSEHVSKNTLAMLRAPFWDGENVTWTQSLRNLWEWKGNGLNLLALNLPVCPCKICQTLQGSFPLKPPFFRTANLGNPGGSRRPRGQIHTEKI